MAESGARLVGFARRVRDFARTARALGCSAVPGPSVCQGFSRLGHRPPCSELIFVSCGKRFGAPGEHLDPTEPRGEPLGSTAQRSLRVDIEPAGHLHPGKQEITDFVLARIVSYLCKFCFDVAFWKYEVRPPRKAARRASRCRSSAGAAHINAASFFAHTNL